MTSEKTLQADASEFLSHLMDQYAYGNLLNLNNRAGYSAFWANLNEEGNLVGENKMFTSDLTVLEDIPQISISDEECHMIHSDAIFDVLGIYLKSTEVDQSGCIILHRECIERYAKSIYDDVISKDKRFAWTLTDCEDALFKIVLWHELGHWITHWMCDPTGNRWGESYWTNRTSNFANLSEGLAQLFTNYTLLRIENRQESAKYLFLFDYLLVGQSEPYHCHKIAMVEPNFSWNKLFEILPLIRQQASSPVMEDFLGYIRNT